MLCDGRLDAAGREAVDAVDATGYFAPLALPIAARAALWAGDLPSASEAARRIEASVYRGQASGLDLATIHAGIAALEGRRADAVARYREVLRGWRVAGLPFDEALATVDMATVLATVRARDAGGIDGHRRGAGDTDPAPGETVPRAPRRRPADGRGSSAARRDRADRTDDGDPGRVGDPREAGRGRSAWPMWERLNDPPRGTLGTSVRH